MALILDDRDHQIQREIDNAAKFDILSPADERLVVICAMLAAEIIDLKQTRQEQPTLKS